MVIEKVIIEEVENPYKNYDDLSLSFIKELTELEETSELDILSLSFTSFQ